MFEGNWYMGKKKPTVVLAASTKYVRLGTSTGYALPQVVVIEKINKTINHGRYRYNILLAFL